MKQEKKSFSELLNQFNSASEQASIKCGEMSEWSKKNEKELTLIIEQQIEFLGMLSIMFLQEDFNLLLFFSSRPYLMNNLRAHNISVLELGYKLGYEACQSKKILGDIK